MPPVYSSVTHIMKQTPHNQPHPHQGKAAPRGDPVKVREAEKNGKYKDVATALHKEFIPLVMDKYGRMGKPFLHFLKKTSLITPSSEPRSTSTSERKPSMTPSPRPTRSCIQGLIETWTRRRRRHVHT